MPIPDFQSLMLPLLRFAADRREYSIKSSVENLAREFRLTEEEVRELLPSGQQKIFQNRVNWAKSYLKMAGLICYTKRGFFKITESGLKILEKAPARIDIPFLKKLEEFSVRRSRYGDKSETVSLPDVEQATPTDLIESAHQKLNAELATELLEQVKVISPDLFEKIVVELLVKMGYGGSRRDAGRAIGGSGDEGIDGIINEDRLGLDVIYIQAKRWQQTIGRPEIQKFAGALQGQRAKKGIFITSSDFSKEARDFVTKIDVKIILMDGNQLAQLLIEHNVGVSTVQIYEVKRIDSDYFNGA